MTSAILYARFSPRPDAKTSQSCEKQLERCKAYCKRMGYSIPLIKSDEEVTGPGGRRIGTEYRAVYTDRNVSGATYPRKGLEKAIWAIEKGDNCILVVDTQDRLARDILVYAQIVSAVQAAGGRIEYANGLNTGNSPEGRLVQGIFALFAAYERDRIRVNTKRGLAKKKANGERVGSIPVGYGLDPKDKKKLVPNLQERAAVKLIHSFHKQGLSSGWIAIWATQMSGTFRGKPWSPRTIRKVIADGLHFED